MIDVTYGILNFNPLNNREATRFMDNCLNSLEMLRNPSISNEVYVIDQNSDDEARLICEHKCRLMGFNYVQLQKNIGISGGINMLSRLGVGKYLCLVTSDTRFTNDLDTIMLGELEAHEDIQQITPAVSKGDVPYQVMGYTQDKDPIRCIAQELTIQFWKKEVFDHIGYWDERWLACYESLDYPLRLFLSGKWSAAISHKAKCHHEHNTTYHNGSLAYAYGGHFDHGPLRQMWDKKWPGLPWDMMYDLDQRNNLNRNTLGAKFHSQVHLSWNDTISLRA